MNIFAPQSIESKTELEEIADLKFQIIIPKTSSPTIAMVQDQLIGIYNLTSDKFKINWRVVMNLLSSVDLDTLVDIKKNKDYEGKEIYSNIIPSNINLIRGESSNPKILIQHGRLEKGVLGDDILGYKKNGLVQLVWDEYGVEPTRKFIDNTSRLANNFNMFHGMSVSIKDLSITPDIYNQIRQLYETKKLELSHEITEIENNPDMSNEKLFEYSVNSKLSVIRDDVSKLIMANTGPDNSFVIMINCGKGAAINFAQMCGILGQQDFHGGRMPKNYNGRTLPYFFKNDDRAEARGFIESSFLNGLNLPNMIFNSIVAREGIIDQAVRSVTGDTKITIIENGEPKVVEIGYWIDNYLDIANKEYPNEIERDINNFELLNVKGIVIPTVDEIGKVTWANVTAITRHDPGNELYEIITTGGRTVKVPESKSLLVWNSNTSKFEDILTPDVKVGDFVPVAMNLCEETNIINGINMSVYFPKEEYKYDEYYVRKNDVVLDKIKEINIINKSKYPKLYDLTVPSTLNFIISSGLGIRDTAQSGYIQRKLIKATEDSMVNYDGTVRNAAGRILQFMYGDSGADTIKQYEYHFKLMDMSNSEIEGRYKFTKEELLKVKNFNEKDNEAYYKNILKIRDNLRRSQVKATLDYITLGTTYMLPINLHRIVDNIRNRPELKGDICYEADFIIDMIINILKNQNTMLYCMTQDERDNPESIKFKDDQIAKTVFRYALFDILAPKKCIINYKLSKKQLEIISKEIIKNYNKNIVEPGEMVGIIAAQSLGEPITQLMLKAIHSAGIGGKGGTDIGVDRIQEVFSISKNPKAPFMSIYLTKEYQNKKDFANKIASHIKFTTIKDIRSKIEIFYDPEPYEKDGYIEKDNIVGIFQTYQPNKDSCSNSIEGLQWLMRIEFDKDKLLNKEVSLLDIKSKFCYAWEKRYQDVKILKREKRQVMDKINQLAILSNTDNDDIPIIHLRFDMINFNSNTLVDFMELFVDEFKLKGFQDIEEISGGKPYEERFLSFDNPEQVVEKKSEYVIYTKGINMDAIKNIIGVDLNRTSCNDIITIYEHFGIEAARTRIIREIHEVLTSNGSGTNYQHIAIFGDLMTNIGTLTSIDRHGLNKLDTDPLSRASFEKTVDQLITAAVFNEVDYMKSVSSRIMAGLCIKGGTGLCNLIVDKDLLENSEYTTDIGQLYQKTYKDIKSIQQIQEIDTDVFIPEI